MQTGEIVDFASERRLSAVLEFALGTGELLIHNGGSKAEEVRVVTSVAGPFRSEQRSTFCVDSGTSLQLVIPVPPDARPHDLTVRVIGSKGELRLAHPRRPHAVLGSVRSWLVAGVAAGAALLVAGAQAPSPGANVVIEPVPAPMEESVVRPRVVITRLAALPAVATSAPKPLRPHLAVVPAVHHAVRPVVARPNAVRKVAPADTARRVTSAPPAQSDVAPRVTSLRVPSTAKSGDFVPVAFGAVAQQVKIVASIGPTIVSKTIVASPHGTVAIRSPKSDLDSRIMTVRAYAQEGNRTAVLQAMVVLVRP